MGKLVLLGLAGAGAAAAFYWMRGGDVSKVTHDAMEKMHHGMEDAKDATSDAIDYQASPA